jgi:5,10-methylenetetrahydromethanopterin reductase
MPERVALYLQDNLGFSQALDAVKYAEARGFDSVWQAETRAIRDPLIAMASYATVTTRIKIASGVVNHWTRNIGALAGELLTLDDIAPDRIMCGLGTGADSLTQRLGITRHKPLLAMRETVAVLRRLLAMERVTFRGETLSIEDFGLDIQFGRKDPRRIPLYIGATGQFLSLAGEIADGVILNYLVSPPYTHHAVEQIGVGVRQSGRDLLDIDIPQLIMCSVDNDTRLALDKARKVVTQALAQQPQLMRANGVPQELIDEIAQLVPLPINDYTVQEAMRIVPDSIVRLVTASGSPTDVRAKVREYMQAGATMPILFCLGDDVRSMVDAFARGYRE